VPASKSAECALLLDDIAAQAADLARAIRACEGDPSVKAQLSPVVLRMGILALAASRASTRWASNTAPAPEMQ